MIEFTTINEVSTHSRLKAAGGHPVSHSAKLKVSTHSRLKAAGCGVSFIRLNRQSFNTQPPEGGWFVIAARSPDGMWFQHTAA